nr:aminotransferase class IV [Lactobacillus amylovorus]
MTKTRPEDLDWNKLGFKYHDLPYRWVDEFKDGKWQGGHLTQDSTITFNEAAEELHYGQEIFEGLKAYRRKDGGINLFRPDQNAKRMANSAKRLLMEPYPEDEFIKAVKEVVLANQDFVPPYGSGGTLYLRPFMMGTQPIVGVSPSETYQFRIY